MPQAKNARKHSTNKKQNVVLFKEVNLPYEEGAPHMAAAMYLAVLVYPKDIEKRTNFVNACRAWWIKMELRKFPRGKIYNKDIKAFGDYEDIKREFDRASKILVKKRQLSGDIAKFALMNLAVPVKVGQQKFTITACLEQWHVRNRANDKKETVANAFMRIWKDSLPVIHLMISLSNATASAGIKGEYQLEDMLLNLRWVKEAAENAEGFRKQAFIMQEGLGARYPLKPDLMIPVLLNTAAA